MKTLKRRVILLLVFTFLAFFEAQVFGQILGDYRTNGNGSSWTTANNWDRFSGTAWVANVSYPGQAGAIALTTVTIRDGHNMILDGTPANSIVSLVIGGGTSGPLTVGNSATGRTLTCTGAVTLNSGANLSSGTGGGSHTLNFQNTLTASLTNGGTINFSNDQITLNISGTTSNNGTLTFGTNTGIKTFTGAVTNTGTWTSTSLTSAANLIFKAGVSSTAGSFAAGGATFNTANQAIGGTAAMSFSDVVSTGFTLTNSNTNTVTISSTITGSGTFAQGTTGNTLNFGGTTIGVTTFTANGASNTVNYVTAAPTTVRDVAYNNLTIAGSNTGSWALGGARTIGGNLSVSNGATLTTSGNQTLGVTGTTGITGTFNIGGTSAKTFTGDVTLFAGSTWNESAASTYNFAGNFANNSTSFTASTGTHNFTGTTKTLSGSSTTSIPAVSVSGTYTNTGTLTVTTSLAGAGTLTQGTGGTLNIGFTGAIGITTLVASTNVNTVVYTVNTPTVRAINYYNLTHSGTGTATVAGISIAGDFNESSSGTFNFTGTTTFNGTANQNINGPGTITFANLAMGTSGSSNLLVNGSISVSGTISWTANGLIVLGSSADLTLAAAASITSPSSTRYIQVDGSGSGNSNLIRTSGNNTTDWAFTFPIGTSTGGYTPASIPTIGTAPVANSTLAVKAIVTSSVSGKLRRTFRLTVSSTNTNATTFSSGLFNYIDPTDLSGTDLESSYNTCWYLAVGGVWTSVPTTINTTSNTFTVTGGTTATASLTSGTYYYTIGSNITTQHTWYSYQTGNYSDFNTWTQDPSGTTYVNPGNAYPTSGDGVEILNGFTVTMDLSGQGLATTTIDGGGILDMSTTTGQSLGVITGTGLLRIKGSTLPTGTYTDFVATTGGTIEFYDIGGTLSTNQTTFNKLKMTNSTGSNITFVEASDLTVNSTFNLSTTGAGTVTWQINDATNTSRTVTLNGDLTVASGGKITVGTGNQSSTTQHAVNVYGNITNSGTIQFFDPTDANLSATNYGVTNGGSAALFYTAALRGNAATVTFTGTTNNTVTCNSQTDFYRFVLNKGTGQIAILIVNSSNTSNFRLFGPFNQGSSGNGTSPNEYSGDALSVINGTLELMGSINIPCLILTGTGTNDYFSIPQNGGLWLNGSNVTVNVTDYNTATAGNLARRLMINGLLRVTSGTIDGGISAGFGTQDGGTYWQEGGTAKCWQFRPRQSGTGIFSFVMTGGTLNVGYNYSVNQGYDNTGYCRFDLNSTNSTFTMSGGTLNAAKPTATTAGGIFQVLSSSANYNVTGGQINLYTGYVTAGTENTGYLNSTVPLYNVSIFRESGSTTSVQLQNQDLTVLNNLTLDNSTNTQNPAFLLSSGTDRNLTVGGSFNIQSSTTFTPGTTTPSTITFNGTGAQTWTHNGTISSLGNVVINKTSGTILTLAGSNTFPNITGATTGLTITSGTLADGGKTITVTGAISNSGTHSGTGSIIVSNATTIGGANGTFGNLTITTANNTIATSGNQTVTGALALNGTTKCILNIASYSLSALGTITTTGTFGTNYFIQTSGLYNAGGITRTGASGDILFPAGISGTYTPNTINTTATTYGTITVRPVNSEHPNVSTTGVSLKYFWRVTSSGFSGITAVTHKTYTFNNATLISGTTVQKQAYRSARWDASALSWGTNNTTYDATSSTPNPNTTVIPNFNTGTAWSGVVGDKLDGEYTCGNVAAFGGVQPYYSAASGAWNATAASNVWTTNSNHSSCSSCLAGPPCANCPVVIGDGVSINHTITIDQNSRSCGTLAINTGSTLDCASFTTLNFGTNTGGAVTGRGTIRISSNAFPTGDFTNFIGSSGGTVEWYGTTKTLPTTYTAPGPTTQNLNTYYNLILNPTAANTITLPASNLTVYNNWTQQTGTGTVTNNGATTLSITGNLTVSAGTFSLTNSGNTTMTVGGSVSK
ncbi:MAG: hypothetical protein QM734_14125 [Cyclobacteriaceae bacterium]